MVFEADFFDSEPEQQNNTLLQYLRQQNPEMLSQVAQSASPEIKQIISQNVRGLIGMLPAENFNVRITTDRENLANLLASAMMTGYFLRQMEQRRDLEATWRSSNPLSDPPSEDSDL